MPNKLLLGTSVLLSGASGAAAQGFTGVSIDIEYSDFPDDEGTYKTTFRAAGEYAISPQLSIALDVVSFGYEDADELSLTNGTYMASIV